MTSELVFEGVNVTLRPSRQARVMRLRVDSRTGKVSLIYPHRVSRRRVLQWASDQRGWVEAALAEVPAAIALAPGATVPLEDIAHAIDWSPEHSRVVRIEGESLRVGGPIETLEPRLLRWLKTRAKSVLTSETHEYAGKAGVIVSRVGIGDPLSRWGSCSSSGAIRYSWRLILAPAWVRRATVAHEVAHRVHMNHGPAFHALVDELFEADPKPARLWLRRQGGALHRIGRTIG